MTFQKFAGVALGLIVGVVAVGWLGLQFQPAPFPARPANPPAPEVRPLPPGLLAPVERFYRQTHGQRIPVITTAVITGRASLRPIPGGPTFPSRFRLIHEAGQNYRHFIEATWFGIPILRVNESYLDGVSRQETPFGSSENEPKGAQAANLGLWAEAIWFPALYLTDSRVRWEALDEHSAVLNVPFGEQRERFIVRFDPQTGRPLLLESMRYKEVQSPEKTLWLNQIIDWGEFGGVTLPRRAALIWMDDGKPWATFTVENLIYNADVRQSVRGQGSGQE